VIVHRALLIDTSAKNERTGSMNSKIISSMILAAAVVTGVSVGSAAYAEGEDGVTAAGWGWRVAKGGASVPATRWYAANPAQRVQLSHELDGGIVPEIDNNRRS
jgi:hypothetical protein